MKLTEKWLKDRKADEDIIQWLINNKLINNLELDDLDKIKGDYNGYISWLKDAIKNILEYDSNGNMIHFKTSYSEYWREYDSNGNVIHFKDSNGYEYWKESDSSGNAIHFKDSKGFEEWREFDSNGNVILFRNSKGYEKCKKYEYNNNGVLIKIIDTKNDNIIIDFS